MTTIQPLIQLPLTSEDYRLCVTDMLRVTCILLVQALLEASSSNKYSIFYSELLMQTILGSLLGVIAYHLVLIYIVGPSKDVSHEK